MADETEDVLKGTLDMLILKALELAPMHGWGIGERIALFSGEIPESRIKKFSSTRVNGSYAAADLDGLLRAACERIAARDDGSLSLDSRKGLVQLPRIAHERPQVI